MQLFEKKNVFLESHTCDSAFRQQKQHFGLLTSHHVRRNENFQNSTTFLIISDLDIVYRLFIILLEKNNCMLLCRYICQFLHWSTVVQYMFSCCISRNTVENEIIRNTVSQEYVVRQLRTVLLCYLSQAQKQI